MADNRNNQNDNKNNSEINVNINRPAKRMWTECNPIDQPEGTYRYALNAIKGTEDGNENFLSAEASDEIVFSLDKIIGSGYLGNGETVLFSIDNTNNSLIGILDGNNNYTNIITTQAINFDINHQIGCEIRIIKNGQRVVYWVDGLNDALQCNIDALQNYWTTEYLDYLNNGGDPATYPTEKWNGEAFTLIAKYASIPQFTDVIVSEYGNILPGSYNFAIQYLDSDLNPTEWISTSNTVNIYNDRVNAAFETIRGSRNVQNNLQNFPPTNKSIQLIIDNLDPNYTFFRVAIIQCAFNTGQTFKVLVSPTIDVNAGSYTYTGNDSELGTIDITEVQANRNNIKQPKYIAQLENRLLLANGADVNYPFCTFQTYASQIAVDIVQDIATGDLGHPTLLNSTLDTSNPKNPKSTFVITGYMPGEVYCMGIVYIMNDLSESPVYHIPGPSPLEPSGPRKMTYYECTDGYSDIHSCGNTGDDYWGNDYLGNPLLGQKLRHPKFPFRSDLDPSKAFLADTLPGVSSILQYQQSITVSLVGVYPIERGQPAVIKFQVRYKLKDIPSVFIKTLTLTQSLIGTPIIFYTGDLELDPIYPMTADILTTYPGIFSIAFPTVSTSVIGAIDNATYGTLMGINFANIIQPPGTIGFYIVRAERTTNDKFVIDNAIIGPTVQFNNQYTTVGRLYPQIYPDLSFETLPSGTPGSPCSTCSVQKVYTQNQEPTIESHWTFSPEHQFFNNKIKPNEIQIEGTYQPLIVRYPYSPDNLFDGVNGGPYPSGWYSVSGHAMFDTLTGYDKFGVYCLNTQAGTNYNTGTTAQDFDVWCPYKVVDFKFYNYNASPCSYTFPNDPRIGESWLVDKAYYLNAADYQVDTNEAGLLEMTYYNAMCDNKISIMTRIPGYNMIELFQNLCISPITGNHPSERIYLNLYSDLITFDVCGSQAPTGGSGLPTHLPIVHAVNYWDLLYVAMLSNKENLYSDFLTRTYYKEHNNPIYFVDVISSESTPGDPQTQRNINLFNGDVKIAEFNPVDTCFLGFKNKNAGTPNNTWEIVAGVALLVAAVTVDIVTLGGGIALTGAEVAAEASLVGLAVSYGTNLLQSGLKYAAMQKMFQYNYPDGLLQAIGDTQIQVIFNNRYGAYAGVGNDTTNMPGGDGYDPTNNQPAFTWYSEMLRGLYIETSASSALRSGITSTGTDFMLTNDDTNNFIYNNLEVYLREKLTITDVNQGSGRLYRGYPNTEFYDLNLDYQRQNHQKQFFCLPINYDCCTLNPNLFPNRVWYSEQSFQEETTDNYRTFLPNNYRDIESQFGPITNVFKQADQLYIHTFEALWLLPKNQQERVTNQISSFVGTGDFFSIPPKLVNDDYLGSCGTQHNWATVKTKKGIFFVNEKECKVYWMGRNTNMYTISYPEVISNIGNETWFKNNLPSQFAEFFYTNSALVLGGQPFDYPLLNNPASPNGLGLLATYDNYYNRVLLTKKDVVVQPDYLAGFIVSDGLVTSGAACLYYNILDSNFYYWDGTTNTQTYLSDTTYFLSASWTISFSIDDMAWISMHSYTPSLYIHNQSRFFSYNFIDSYLRIHLINGDYLTFGDTYCPFIVEYVSLSNPLTVRTWDTIMLNTVCRQYIEALDQFVVIPNRTFQQGIFYNSRQSSGLQNLGQIPINDPNYMQSQVVNTTEGLIISTKENYWRINEIRDYVSDYTVPLFAGNQYSNDITLYNVDKIVNSAAVTYTKAWYQREVLRDRYMVVRLIYNVDKSSYMYNLMVCYSIEFEKISTR